MTDASLIDRITAYLPENAAVTLSSVRDIHREDPDLLYELANFGVGDDAPIAAKGLEFIARTISVLVRDGFAIETAAKQKYARGNKGGILALDGGDSDVSFLQSLHIGNGYASKLESKKRSSTCLDFYLEDHEWDNSVRQVQLLRVAPDDASAVVNGLPKYQYESLLDSAREIVRNPSIVYRGLRHKGTMASEGLAFCGIPTRYCRNDGKSRELPEGFTFVAFATPDGFIFDWDWVPSSPENPLLPRDAEERFAGVAPGVSGELLLGNVRCRAIETFKPQRPWHSRKGDCVFWYQGDVESYAGRYDEYLTPFFALHDKKICVGFKIKMVSQLIETAKEWSRAPHEGIVIEFNPEAVTVNLRFLMQAWIEVNLPNAEELFPGMRLIEFLGREGLAALEASEEQINIPIAHFNEYSAA